MNLADNIQEAQLGLKRARAALLTLSASHESRAIENAFSRTDEALGWIGRVSLATKARRPVVDEADQLGDGERAWNNDNNPDRDMSHE